MSLTNAYEKVVLDYLFGSGTPASYDLGVSSTEPADNGSNITEPSTGGYARVAITNNPTNFPPAPTGGPKTTGADFQFAAASGVAWNQVARYWMLFDGATLAFYGTLSPEKSIDVGDVLRIPATQMLISAD